jgi:hypothetical protein
MRTRNGSDAFQYRLRIRVWHPICKVGAWGRPGQSCYSRPRPVRVEHPIERQLLFDSSCV